MFTEEPHIITDQNSGTKTKGKRGQSGPRLVTVGFLRRKQLSHELDNESMSGSWISKRKGETQQMRERTDSSSRVGKARDDHLDVTAATWTGTSGSKPLRCHGVGAANCCLSCYMLVTEHHSINAGALSTSPHQLDFILSGMGPRYTVVRAHIEGGRKSGGARGHQKETVLSGRPQWIAEGRRRLQLASRGEVTARNKAQINTAYLVLKLMLCLVF